MRMLHNVSWYQLAPMYQAKKEKDPELTPAQRKLEQAKYGIYFDDDYNYLQHLKDAREVTMVLQPKSEKRKEKPPALEKEDTVEDEDKKPAKLQLPSSVFASEVEEDVGMLNKAASQGLCLDLDPDVVAALDEDFDFENPDNELEDNFIELAMGDNDGSESDDDDGSEDSDASGDDSEKAFASDLDTDDDSDSQRGKSRMPSWEERGGDTKSRFSQYSMSSSVMRRNQGLSLLDDRFEKMFQEYDDTEVGPLDLEEIEGFIPESHSMLLKAAEEFEEGKKIRQYNKENVYERYKYLDQIDEERSGDELVTMEVEQQNKWDCESILSTYSNLFNHPKLIEEPKKQKIKINPKTGLPEGTFGTDNKLTVRSLARFNALNAVDEAADDDAATHAQSVLSTLSLLSIRPKDESSEDKKERKRLIKEFRKERRIEKKANKEAFKEEKKRQEKIYMNNRNNVQGNKIL